ncbi:MAG: hypothetical protein U0359_20590 [Byssovorax sp.]
MLGPGASTAAIEGIVDRGGGNPFFLEELIRAEAEGRGGALPDTVVAMVEARLEALPPEARRVLRAASVFGETFWRGGVLSLLRGSVRDDEIDAHLSFLVERETIVRRLGSRFSGEPEHGFRHALVRDAAYAMLIDDDRRLGHRLAAGWLDVVGERDALTMGEHLERGGEPARAVPFYRAAAGTAFQGSDLPGVVRAAERALACGAEGEIRGEALYLKAEAHFWRGEGQEASRDVEACVTLLPSGTAFFCQAMGGISVTRIQAGAFDEASPIIATLLSIEPAISARVTYLRGVQANVLMLSAVGRHDDARRFLERLTQVAALQGEADPLAQAHFHLGRASAAHLLDGDPARALHEARAARASFLAAGGSPSVGFVDNEELLARGALGDLSASADLDAAIAVAERLGGTPFLPLHLALAALLHGRAGRRTEARDLAARAARAIPDPGDQVFAAQARALLAWALLAAGDAEGAARAAEHALDRVRGTPSRAAATAILALAILSLRGADGANEALTAAREASILAAPLSSIGYEDPLPALALAESLLASGLSAEARATAETARNVILARADSLPDALARAAFLAVPERARLLDLAGH